MLRVLKESNLYQNWHKIIGDKYAYALSYNTEWVHECSPSSPLISSGSFNTGGSGVESSDQWDQWEPIVHGVSSAYQHLMVDQLIEDLDSTTGDIPVTVTPQTGKHGGSFLCKSPEGKLPDSNKWQPLARRYLTATIQLLLAREDVNIPTSEIEPNSDAHSTDINLAVTKDCSKVLTEPDNDDKHSMALDQVQIHITEVSSNDKEFSTFNYI
ncbi:uncharacterized protein LOC123482678 [Coregonus clupeaformis]|uniref:uncharacterized protein LOC123482678 n=1 Tax=Coregonus clupeaformis TaxID=59861 RepID=UPI001E1C7EF5|nr:uncharacterized protein LOC123482678 [Coregonus clupeaformis]